MNLNVYESCVLCIWRNKADAYQVSTKISQYTMRQHVWMTLSGSQIPRVASSSVLALEARSIGTSSTIPAGSHSAKNTVTRTNAGVVRSGR